MPIIFYTSVAIEIFILIFSPFKKQGLPLLFLILLGLLFSYVPINTSDNWVYNWYFVHPEVSTKFEPLFNWLMNLSYYQGMNYFEFKITLFILEMVFLYWGLRVMKVENKRFVILLYTLVHFFESGIQLRNYLMAVMVFVALAYLWRANKYDYLKFCLLIISAILVQSAAAFFLIFIPLRKLKSQRSQIYFITLISLLALFIALPGTRNVYVAIVNGLVSHIPVVGPKILQYAFRFEPGMIIFLDIPVTILLYLFFTYLLAKLKNVEDDQLQSYVRFGQLASLFLFAIFPLYLVAYNFDRILIDTMLVFFAIFSKLFSNTNQRSKWTILIISVGLFGIYGYASYHYGAKYSNTYESVLYQNTLYPDTDHVMKGSTENE